MPIVRTFVPVVAGIGKMPYRRFAFFNVIGGISWVVSMTVAGYFLGQIEFVKKHIELIVIGIIVLSVLPAVIAWLRARVGPKAADPVVPPSA
jgi:membrane-associated protein